MRLLSKRYDLTSYKYLEIEINIGPPSYVEITLGDHRGHDLSLSLVEGPLRAAMEYLQNAAE